MVAACSIWTVSGCNDSPEVPVEHRQVRVALDPADRVAIAEARFEPVRLRIIEIRRLEAAAPGPDAGVESQAAHADRVTLATQSLVAVMADEFWTREERRMMQRVLRYATLSDLEPSDVGDVPSGG